MKLAALRFGLAGVLGAGAALLVACGTGSSSLIPANNAGFLQSDFNAIQSSVESGECTQAKSEVAKTREDLAALPGTVNAALLETLTTGVRTLAARAATECKLNAASGTTTTGQTSTPTQTQTNTTTQTTPTTTDTTTDTTPTQTDTTPTDTNTDTTPTDTNTAPSTTVPGSPAPPSGVGGTQAPGTPAVSADQSGGTPGGGN